MTRAKEEALEAAKVVRDSKKKGFEEVATQLQNCILNEATDIEDIKDLLDVVQDEYQALKRANSEVLLKMLDAKKTVEDYQKEESEIRAFQRQGLVIISRAKRRVQKNEDDNRPQSSGPSPSPVVVNMKLPKIDLPKFSGDIRDWLPFWSQFKEIDENAAISDSDKFQYLIQSTTQDSEAREVVMSFPVCAENYPLAIKQLKNMYGRDKMLVKVYIRDLLKLVIDNATNKKTTLSSLYFKLSAKLKALATLGVTTDKCASVIYPLVESCLPEEVLRTWQRHPTCQAAAEGEEELNKLIEFLEEEVGAENNIRLACDGLKGEGGQSKQSKPNKNSGAQAATAAGLLAVESADQKKNMCIFCDKNHASEVCRKAISMTLEEKDKIIREKRACYNCLKLYHNASKCRTQVKCVACGRRHQTIMCRGNNGNPSPQQSKQQENSQSNSNPVSNQPSPSQASTSAAVGSLSNQIQSPDVLLQTLKVKVHGENGVLTARALVDTGSHKSYILKSLAERVGLKRVGTEQVVHNLFGGTETKPVEHVKYKIYLSDLNDTYTCNFDVSDVSKISGKLSTIPRGPWLQELKEKRVWVTDVGDEATEIEVLIGIDVTGKLITGNKYELQSGPVAMETLLGWTLVGKLPVQKSESTSSSMMVFNMHVQDAEIKKLWELDTIGISDPTEKKTRDELEESAMKHFQETVKQNEDGRYEVHLPWIEGHQPLPQNQNVAEKRLRTTTANLKKDGTLSQYDELFKMWEEKGFIEEVPESEVNNYGHYLPHRAVYKPNSETTPIRPVFDASCKVKGQPSLNDCLEKGPNFLELIPAVVTRFRLDPVAVIADIEKAFPQISVTKKDRDFLRFLWWKDLSCSTIKVYRHCRVVFGVSCSPFLLAAVLKHILDRVPEEFKEAAELLQKSLYVDNVAASISDKEKSKQFQTDATKILSSSKFNLRGWVTGPNEDEDKYEPLLGLSWGVKDDILKIDTSQVNKKKEGPVTKRKILSLAHTIFDPIGFTAPFTILPKLLLQEAWELKLGWDSILPDDIVKRFEGWINQMPLLEDLRVPRWITNTSSNKEDWSLHVFVDASKKVFAACTYLRVAGENGVSVQLVQAKARVAPLKTATIPRLELLSCGIGARQLNVVREIIGIPDIKVNLWTDSSTALYWIQNDKNWGVWVQGRVAEIRKLTKIDDWRHIPGEENVADIPSRGCSLPQLILSRWWEGPAWLKLEENDWPKSTVNLDKEEIDKEMKKTVVSALSHGQSQLLREIYACEGYEDMILKMFHEVNSQATDMKAEDFIKTEKKLLKLVQDATFDGEHDLRFKQMGVFTDKNDKLIKTKTKLLYGDFPEEFKCPVVLPNKNPVVNALIRYEHRKNSHAGVQTLRAILRQQYWIFKSLKTIRNALTKCEGCQRFAAKKIEVETAPLPKDRMQAEVPFQVTGVDMMGPLFLKDGSKTYVALFTCAVYRAVHLELVSSLSTEAFKNALRRFIGRRGRPSIIYSDNGTNFVGCHNAFKSINWKKIEKYGSYQKITWRFNPPTAAWWGGFWERMVGVVKQTLRKVLGKASLDFEELQTVLCEAESIANQRPLTYMSEDPEDLEPLTPQLFLTGSSNSNVPEADEWDGRSLKKRWRYMQRIREDLRSRFKKEYLGQLPCTMNKKKPYELKIGEKVLIGHDNMKRLDWPMGTIAEVIPSRDGTVRSVRVKTGEGLLFRPIQRIYPLEVPTEDEASEIRDEELSLPHNTTSESSKDQRVETVTKSGRRVKIPVRLTYINLL